MGLTLASETGASSADGFIDGVYGAVESFAVNSVHPAYIKAREDPILSKLLFLVALLWLLNTFAVNIFGIITCGKCKVIVR